jgi:hypothetical protein
MKTTQAELRFWAYLGRIEAARGARVRERLEESSLVNATDAMRSGGCGAPTKASFWRVALDAAKKHADSPLHDD